MTQRPGKLFCYFFLLSLVECHEKEQRTIYQVAKEAEPFVTAFYSEASLRGKDLKPDNLIVEFAPLESDDWCGECVSEAGNPHSQKRIRLSMDASCWAEQTRTGRAQDAVDTVDILDDDAYARAVAVLGEQGLLELVVLVGYYAMLAQLMGVFGVGAPEGSPAPATRS